MKPEVSEGGADQHCWRGRGHRAVLHDPLRGHQGQALHVATRHR